MKIFLSYLYFIFSFICLFTVCNEEKWEPINVFFWACVFGTSVLLVNKQLKKYGERDTSKTSGRRS